MNLQWLIYFQTIAELENNTQATKKLHVSQSNLSHAMRSLEEKLGVELFEKDGRNIRLSKYGEIFLPYVNKTLDSLDEGIAKLKEFLDPNTGTIELAGFPSVAQFSTDLMVRYQSETNRYDVHFQYAQIGWYEIHELIVSGKIDLCIATKFEEPEVAGTYIGDHPLVVIVPENHYLASRERVDLRELQDENFIGFNQNGQLAPMLQKTFASLGIEPRVVSRTPSDLIIYGLVAGGRGDDAAGDLLLGKRRDLVVRATNLERTGHLQVLRLEQNLMSGHLGQHRGRNNLRVACGALQSFGGQFQFSGMITPQCFEHLVLFHGRYCKRTSAENAVRLPNRNRIPAVPQNRTEKETSDRFRDEPARRSAESYRERSIRAESRLPPSERARHERSI